MTVEIFGGDRDSNVEVAIESIREGINLLYRDRDIVILPRKKWDVLTEPIDDVIEKVIGKVHDGMD